MSTTQKHRKPLIIAILVVFAWLMVSGITGQTFGKLSDVQKNDNSKFLPDGVESNKAAAIINTFATGPKDQFPTLVPALTHLSQLLPPKNWLIRMVFL